MSSQGASPWRCWRTWAQVRFTWWKFLHLTTWAMDRFPIRWSWQSDQISPLVTMLVSLTLQRTLQVGDVRAMAARSMCFITVGCETGSHTVCLWNPSQAFLMVSTTWTRRQWRASLWESASRSSASLSVLSSLSAEAKTGTLITIITSVRYPNFFNDSSPVCVPTGNFQLLKAIGKRWEHLLQLQFI